VGVAWTAADLPRGAVNDVRTVFVAFVLGAVLLLVCGVRAAELTGVEEHRAVALLDCEHPAPEAALAAATGVLGAAGVLVLGLLDGRAGTATMFSSLSLSPPSPATTHTPNNTQPGKERESCFSGSHDCVWRYVTFDRI